MPLLSTFEWLENTALGTAIRESVWYFPVIEGFHLVALAVLGGSALLVDLRLLGALFPGVPVQQLAGDARPWLLRALGVLLLTGSMLFLSEAVKCYYSTAFWVKMSSLLLAVLFLFTARQKVIEADPATLSKAACKSAGAISIVLWFTVAAAGRWIGFS